jgi:hypothetical protein
MDFLQSPLGLGISLGVVTVLFFALPVMTLRWKWVWLLVFVVAAAVATNAYLTFTGYWEDRHGFLIMWAILFAWPLVIGLIAAALGMVLSRFPGTASRYASWAVVSLGLLASLAPYTLLLGNS